MSMQRGRTATPSYTPPVLPVSSGKAAPSIPPVSRQLLVGRLWKQARGTLKGQFVVLAAVIMLLAVVQAALVSQAFRSAYSQLDTIYNGSAPSVDAAQAMTQYIDDIDAKSADYLATAALTEQVPCALPGTNKPPGPLTVHDCDDQTIDAEIILANQQLFDAAHNVTYAGEQTAIERITAGFEEYISHISIMRYEYAQALSKTDAHDAHLMNAYHEYLAANAVLQRQIARRPLTNASGAVIFDEQDVPSCTVSGKTLAPDGRDGWVTGSLQTNIDCLSAINYGHLQAAYANSQSSLGGTIALICAICVVFCVLLIFAFGRMALVTHRVFNLGLTVAAVAAIVFSIVCISLFVSMSGDRGSFKQMVKDDYDSIYAADLLKRYGTNANADESRWLIALIFGDAPSAMRWQADWRTDTQIVQADLKKAVSNRTWLEEDQPLRDMQVNWDQYFSIDGRIRSAANSSTDPKHLITAETLSTGESNAAFSKFTDAVERLSQANRGHYDSTYQSTQGAVMLLIVLSAVLYPLIGLSAIWGISQRLKDF